MAVSNTMRDYEWAECTKAKDVLNELGLKYTKRSVALTEINWKVTDKNCGRLGEYGKAFDPETVDDYSEAMKKGDRFPMPVVGETLSDGLVIAAGVHRSKAAEKAGMNEIWSYVFKCDLPQHLRLVAVLTNRKEGVRVNAAAAMEYAIDLATNYKMEPKNIATLLGVSWSTLDAKLRIIKYRQQLAAGGCRAKLSDANVRALGGISSNTKVMVEAANYVEAANVPEDAVRDLVKRLKEVKNQDDQLALINKEWDVATRVETVPTQTGAPAKIVLPVRTKFLRALSTLQKIIEGKTTMADLQLTSEDYSHVREQWATIRKSINSITKE